MASQRISEVDILKGIGILLVMAGHALMYGSPGRVIIYTFHMPLFFWCSGFFYKERPLRESVVRDAKSILIPWLFFCCVLTASAALIGCIRGDYSLLQFNPLDENAYCLYHTIWFLPCLFLVRLFYRLLRMLVRTEIIAAAVALVAYAVACALGAYGVNLPFFVDSALAMLLFYYLGSWFMRSKFNAGQIPAWLCVLLLAVYAAAVWWLQPMVNVKDNAYPVYMPLMTMIPLLLLYFLSKHLNARFLMKCGAASLVIMGLHHPFFDLIMLRWTAPTLLHSVVMVAAVLPVVLGADRLIRRFCPWLLGRF